MPTKYLYAIFSIVISREQNIVRINKADPKPSFRSATAVPTVNGQPVFTTDATSTGRIYQNYNNILGNVPTKGNRQNRNM